jgi:hypothetical protein
MSLNILASEKFVFEKCSISISVPKDWQSARDMFGMPLTLMGSELNGGRPVVTITPTGLRDFKFDQKSLEQNQNEFKNGREEWLKNQNGKSLVYYPYKVEHKKNNLEIHRIGYSFEITEIKYIENTYYIFCAGQLFHLTTLLRQSHEKNYERTVEEVIGSFDCK